MAPSKRESPLIWPIGVTTYILVLSAFGFACSVRELPWWYQALVAAMAVIAVGCLWLTNQMDPGTLQPKSERDEVIDLLEGGQTIDQYVKDSKGRWTRTVFTEDGFEDLEKFCMACNVWRPRRGYHCEQCEFCMVRGDHHCAVVGNCVALRNHRFFAALLCSAWAGCMLLMGGSIWRLKSAHPWDEAETYFLIILAVIFGYHAAVLIFGVFHAVGLVLDFTTKDVGSEDGDCGRHAPCFPGKRSPRALVRSWRAVCCGPFRWKPQPRPRSNVPQGLLAHDDDTQTN